MEYRRLPFEQYFIDTSEDYTKTGNVRKEIKYKTVEYAGNKIEKVLKIKRKVDYSVFYDEERETIQVHFRRAINLYDWLTSFEFLGRFFSEVKFGGEFIKLYVHKGWLLRYKAIKNNVRNEWLLLREKYPEAETEIVGWSLGSAEAMLCAQDLNWNYGLLSHLFTFGSVKPFKSHKKNDTILEEYLKSTCSECYNFSDNNDLISYLPPFKSYKMIEKRTLSLKKKNIFRLCNPVKYHTLYFKKELYDGLNADEEN